MGVYVDGLNVYAATGGSTTGGGLSISTDGGNTFVNKTTANGLGDDSVIGVYVDGGNVYTATYNGLSTNAPLN